jgi:DNA-binding transcriptional LysR family regulator
LTPTVCLRIASAISLLFTAGPRDACGYWCQRLAAMTVLAPKLRQFAREYPDVVLDVTTDDSRMDLVAARFDAGIQFGVYIEQDMVAVRVSPDLPAAIVASPTYFASHPKPKSPRGRDSTCTPPEPLATHYMRR